MPQPLNIHPLIVHFPIALFTVYAVMELARFKKLTSQPYWFYIKAVFVTLGVLTSYLAIISGNLIKSEFNSLKDLVSLHSNFGIITSVIFTVIAVAYVFSWLNKGLSETFLTTTVFGKFTRGISKIADWFLGSSLVILFALAGLVSIIITGALGAAVAFGPNQDPFVSFVYHMFFK